MVDRIVDFCKSLQRCFTERGFRVPGADDLWLRVMIPRDQAYVQALTDIWDNDASGDRYKLMSQTNMLVRLATPSLVKGQSGAVNLKVSTLGKVGEALKLRNGEIDFDTGVDLSQEVKTEVIEGSSLVSVSQLQEYWHYSMWFLLDRDQLTQAIEKAKLILECRRIWETEFPGIIPGDYDGLLAQHGLRSNEVALSTFSAYFPWDAPEVLVKHSIDELWEMRIRLIEEWASVYQPAMDQLFHIRDEVLRLELWDGFNAISRIPWDDGSWGSSQGWSTPRVIPTETPRRYAAYIGNQLVLEPTLYLSASSGKCTYGASRDSIQYPSSLYVPGTAIWREVYE